MTLALCIGATTAIFSVVYAVLFRPLPFADPQGILVVRETWKGRQGSMSAGNWWDTKRTDRMFQYLVPMNGARVNLAGAETPENVTGARVGADYFALLGVRPALGRAFLPEEDRPGADGVVVLSDGLWRRRFGGDPSVVGRDVRIDGLPQAIRSSCRRHRSGSVLHGTRLHHLDLGLHPAQLLSSRLLLLIGGEEGLGGLRLEQHLGLRPIHRLLQH